MLSFMLSDCGPRLRGQIGGFRMETPATSSAAPITSLAPKRAVMIDDLSRALFERVNDGGDTDPVDAWRSNHGDGRRSRTARGEDRAPHRKTLTCTSCHIVHIGTSVDAAEATGTDWVCPTCTVDPRCQ